MPREAWSAWPDYDDAIEKIILLEPQIWHPDLCLSSTLATFLVIKSGPECKIHNWGELANVTYS